MSAKVEAQTGPLPAEPLQVISVCNAESSAGDAYDALSSDQVKLRVNKRFRMIVASVTIFAVFTDILGTALLMPAMGPLCWWAEGGPADKITKMPIPHSQREAMIDELVNPYAFKDPKPPFKFSLSINMIIFLGQVGSCLGSLVFGRLVDTIGCKIPMQISLFAGLIGYMILYAGAVWAKSYWLFALGVCWNNFFGTVMGTAVVYLRGVFEEGPDRDAWVGACMGLGMVGASVGGIVVLPLASNPKNGENVFQAVWIAIGMTVVALLAVTYVIVPLGKPLEEESKETKGEDKDKDQTPVMARRILWLTIIASALDSGGDEGTRMARGTILASTFPVWGTIERQNYLLLSAIGIVLMVMPTMGIFRKWFNLGSIAVIGCFFTLATQLVLIAEWDDTPFLILWHGGKFFGFLSNFASSFIVQETSPPNLLGQWSGRNDALTNICQGISPLIFATVYDAFGNVRGQEMLVCTSVISLFATIAYAPLIAMLPKPPKQEEKHVHDIADTDYYLKMSEVDYRQLPIEVVEKVSTKLIEQGKPPRIVSWGDYNAERSTLMGLQDRAVKDFEYVNSRFTQMLTNREVMMKEQANFKKMTEVMPAIDRDTAKKEMGAWIADYFDDAGYVNWETQCTIFKSMLMTAFPPIDAIDEAKPDYSSMSLPQWEENMTKFLSVMDCHLATSQRQVRTKITANEFNNVVRRR